MVIALSALGTSLTSSRRNSGDIEHGAFRSTQVRPQPMSRSPVPTAGETAEMVIGSAHLLHLEHRDVGVLLAGTDEGVLGVDADLGDLTVVPPVSLRALR
ncbi:hypothetical protein [Allokutzneria multivorans]|uniref:hypothetical protein n=1 Tax=Allokutzneria multivorans TaxID=1142134 RepID=UPI0031E9CD53